MKLIHKFTLKPERGFQPIKVRNNAKLLKCAAQGDLIALWYEFEAGESWDDVKFMIYHTGEKFDMEIHKRAEYIDTVLFDNGEHVLHVYQLK